VIIARWSRGSFSVIAQGWRGVELHENGGALDDVRAGLAEEVKNLSFRGCIRSPREILLGRRYRRAGASRGGCPSTTDDEKSGYPLLSTSNLYRTGGLAASPGSCRIIAG
jgi:hypothetical protein